MTTTSVIWEFQEQVHVWVPYERSIQEALESAFSRHVPVVDISAAHQVQLQNLLSGNEYCVQVPSSDPTSQIVFVRRRIVNTPAGRRSPTQQPLPSPSQPRRPSAGDGQPVIEPQPPIGVPLPADPPRAGFTPEVGGKGGGSVLYGPRRTPSAELKPIGVVDVGVRPRPPSGGEEEPSPPLPAPRWLSKDGMATLSTAELTDRLSELPPADLDRLRGLLAPPPSPWRDRCLRAEEALKDREAELERDRATLAGLEETLRWREETIAKLSAQAARAETELRSLRERRG